MRGSKSKESMPDSDGHSDSDGNVDEKVEDTKEDTKLRSTSSQNVKKVEQKGVRQQAPLKSNERNATNEAPKNAVKRGANGQSSSPINNRDSENAHGAT